MEQQIVEESKKAFGRGQDRGQQLELLRAVVLAKLAYWDALLRLEKAVTNKRGFSDKANDDVVFMIEQFAASASSDAYEDITKEHLAEIHVRVDRHPNESEDSHDGT